MSTDVLIPAAVPQSTDREDIGACEAEVLRHFDECGDALHGYVCAFGLAPSVAEDIVQETFLALFAHLRSGRPRTNLRGWLFRVARNLAWRERRAARRRGGLLLAAVPEQTSRDGHADLRANPEEQLVEAERTTRLRAVFDALPARDRQCVQLRADGWRYREIAAALGISLGTVATTLARAIGRLTRADSR